MRVDVHEWPLPEDLVLQQAVIFELRIPQSIACLRDSLHLLQKQSL